MANRLTKSLHQISWKHNSQNGQELLKFDDYAY